MDKDLDTLIEEGMTLYEVNQEIIERLKRLNQANRFGFKKFFMTYTPGVFGLAISSKAQHDIENNEPLAASVAYLGAALLLGYSLYTGIRSEIERKKRNRELKTEIELLREYRKTNYDYQK